VVREGPGALHLRVRGDRPHPVHGAGAGRAGEGGKRGKTPTDTWWSTIVSPSGKEKTGYPTQKPLRVVERIVRVHSRAGERLLDFFAGSGTFGEAAVRLGRPSPSCWPSPTPRSSSN
jgi:DNA modification methylase